MSEGEGLHSRRTAQKLGEASSASSSTNTGPAQAQAPTAESKGDGLPLIPILVAVAVIGAVLVFKLQQPEPSGVFLPADLAKFNGKKTNKLYMSVYGEVYDVTPGKKHYGPQSGYYYFIGKDASRSFGTGVFKDEPGVNTHRLDDLSKEELAGVLHWIDFYKNNKQGYRKVAKFAAMDKYAIYDENGDKTDYGRMIDEKLQEVRDFAKAKENEKNKFTICSSKWSVRDGGKIWCQDGYAPRIGSVVDPASTRCGCYPIEFAKQHKTNLKVIDGCDEDSSVCYKKEMQP